MCERAGSSRLTLSLIFVLMAWYIVQTAALFAGWDSTKLGYWFATNASMDPTPGMIFALFSHAFFPNTGHILSNLVVLTVFGGASERHMSAKEYISFLLVVGYAATFLSTAIKSSSTLGSSVAVYGYAAFYPVHMLLIHRDNTAFRSEKFRVLPTNKESVRVYRELILILVPPALLVLFLGQAVGLIPVGQQNVMGHAIGFLLGASWALGRKYLDFKPC